MALACASVGNVGGSSARQTLRRQRRFRGSGTERAMRSASGARRARDVAYHLLRSATAEIPLFDPPRL
jgi:hypothetical protein